MAKQKLGQGWTGPYLVDYKVFDILYRIQALSESKSKVFHINNSTPMRKRSCPPIGNTFHIRIKPIVPTILTKMNSKIVMMISNESQQSIKNLKRSSKLVGCFAFLII